jgi:TfoX/Sxy family transcriptional regulator of competence genes
MKWRKPSEELIKTFEAVTPGPPAVARQMFGFPAAFVNGNMFMGLHQEDMILRLPEEPRAELLKISGARTFEPMPGRPMREYVVVPPSLLKDRNKLGAWATKALDYGSSLAPKSGKTGSKKGGSKKSATSKKTAKKASSSKKGKP